MLNQTIGASTFRCADPEGHFMTSTTATDEKLLR